MTQAPNWLLELGRDILERNGIEPFGDRALQWHLPPEVIEDYLEPDMENRMYGYPVTMEALLGERSVVLTETLAHEQIPSTPSG